MPLFSEHISNMYYSGSPSYTSPSYGYKSSFTPLGNSYSASYLSPGGSYSKHSSLGSYSRAPLSSRWIPGMSRNYSPLLTPISERGTASPIRINSPRRIPIAKRCYGTPSYIQRPININTESIDVSRDRYRPKPAEPSASTSSPLPQRNDPVKDNENSPFMPRVDGKPVTGIDSSPGIQRSTIKRGRTVVRLHTIKRKEKDSPRKPTQLQSSDVNKQDESETSVNEPLPEEPKELSWREKLSEDLVYVDKKEKKSLGTKLVEKFILKDLTEKNSIMDKCDTKSSDGSSQIVHSKLIPSSEVPTTSKSPDRRCSMEMLAEQACLLDSLIRGENLSTATLDLSKIGIADETKNKFASSDSIKRKNTDDKGFPLKTTKSDHSLHDNLKKSVKSGKDPKILIKRRSLKKSHSGGSICRLDSITEFPKELKEHIELSSIEENRYSPKEVKIKETPKLRTKITATVEVSPPSSPLKFRIENITVEEKHHTPKKEVSFSYEIDETPTQDVTLQGPKTTLRRTKERNSVKKKSKNIKGSDPISPEPDDGNFWAKIGKRETVYLMKRKQNIEEAKEKNKRSFLWFPENEEADDFSNDARDSKLNVTDIRNDLHNQGLCSDLSLESEPTIPLKENEVILIENEVKKLETIAPKIEKTKSSDNMKKIDSNSNSSLLKEKATKPVVEPKNGDSDGNRNNPLKKLFRQDAEIKEEELISMEINNSEVASAAHDSTTNLINTNSKILNNIPSAIKLNKQSSPVNKISGFNETPTLSAELSTTLEPKSDEPGAIENKPNADTSTVATTELKTTKNNTSTLQSRSKSEGNIQGKQAMSLSEKSVNKNASTEILTQANTTPVIKIRVLKTRAKSEGKSFEKNSKVISVKNESATPDVPKALSEINALPSKTRAKSEAKSQEKNSKPELGKKIKIETAKANVEVKLSLETLDQEETAPAIKTPALKTRTKSERSLKGSKPISEKIETTASEKTDVDINLCAKVSVDNKTDSVITKLIHSPPKIDNENLDESKKSGTTGNESHDDVNMTLAAKTNAKSVSTKSHLQTAAKSLDSRDSKTEKIDTIMNSKSNGDLNLSSITTKSVNITPILQTQVKSKEQSLKKGSNSKLEIIEKNESANVDNKLQEKVNTVSTLQTQAKRKIEYKTAEQLVKDKQVEPVKNVKSNAIISESNSNLSADNMELSSNLNANKAEGKGSEMKNDTKVEKCSSAPKEKICETCKKSVASDSSKTKLNVTSINDSSPSQQGKKGTVDKIVSAIADPTNDAPGDKSVLAISGTNSTGINTGNSNSSSQTPIVIETKNIPNETVASDTELVPTVPSQETTGEENKSEKDTNGGEDPNQHLSRVKPKEEKAVKPLIATPRPLKKRAPQVIHSDSSESSSEEDSSEEEDSDTSEECGAFYECENNPDGRTSTGSNDSGFDSSAPTSPASFLQIKKDCDVNCHRKCEKLTANLCGVNQRLLVEALATRTASKKGGGDSPGPSSSNASSQLPATDVGDSELELEQSTAYGIFRKTGRFTPPARSIPRFRKYNIEDFQFIKVLGKGSFGKVLLAELRDTEYYYAVKCLKKDVVLEDDDVECTLIERKVLALGTNHPYLCHLFATFQTDSHLFFVMEYLNGGDLMFHIQQSGRFPEARARFYAAEIVSGLKFLHKRGIVYRDLKLDNILLDFDGHVRIADFGMCKLQIYLDKTADTFCGTPDYMAPEIIKGLKYNQTVDWWSFGVLLYEMLIGQSPFSGCDEDELFWSICNEMPSYPRFLSREALTILTRLLDKDARTRLGGTECMHGDVREQEFFRPVHWDKLERRELETPFKPRVRHPLDTQYFDRAFTGERPRLTAVEPHVLRSMDQEPFRGFSYTNPNATDR